MRKLFLWLMLFALVIVPGSAEAVESVPVEFSRVGMFKVFSANSIVVIENGDVESKADYSAITSYDYTTAFFGASIKGKYKEGDPLPTGTLTTPSNRYSIYGYMESGNLIAYLSNSSVTDTKARWSLNSTPASVGSTIIPPYKYFRYDYQEIPEMDSIVPHVELEHSNSGYKITGVKVYFAESGDTTPVSTPDISAVRVLVGNELEGFTDFDGSTPIICTMSADQSDRENFYVYVAYDRGDNTYSWTFRHPSHRDDYRGGYTVWQIDNNNPIIESFNFALSTASPDTMLRYSSRDIKITLSGDIEFQEFFAGNEDIISLDYEMSKDIYSNDVILAHISAKNPGYTTLRLKYSLYGEDYTRIHTVSVQTPDKYMTYYYSSGYIGEETEGWSDESSLSPYVKAVSYDVSVGYVEGRPFYETLTSSYSVSLGLECDDDDASFSNAEGYIFIASTRAVNGRYSMRYDGEGRFSIIDRYGNENFTNYDFLVNSSYASYTKWVEAPGYNELNGIVSFDIVSSLKTRNDILSGDFMPYVEIALDGNTPKTIKWSFIDPSTKQKLSSLPSGMEDLHVWYGYNGSGKALTDSSGEIDISGTTYRRNVDVYVSYRLDGEYYRWTFSEASTSYSIMYDSGRLAENPLRIPEGGYVDVSFDVSSSYSGYSLRIEAGSTDIVSVDLVSVDLSTTRQSIRIYGKAEGQTTISLIAYKYNDDGNLWSSYRVSGPYLIYAGGYEPPETPEPEEMYLDVGHSYRSYAQLIEGKPFYYDRNNDSYMEVTLRKRTSIVLSRDSFNNREYRAQLLHGTLSLTDTSGEVSSQDIELQYHYTYDENDINIYSTYYEIGELPSGTIVQWNFPSLDISGESTVTYNHVRTSLEQHNTYMPHVELVVDGLYVTGIKWFFADSHDNPVQVSGITDISISANNISGYSNLASSGDITFTAPVPVSRYDDRTIYFNFTENGIDYYWYFRGSDGYNNYDSNWNVSSDFPIVMSAGETRNITFNTYTSTIGSADWTVLAGSNILGVDIASINESTRIIAIKLTAKEPGVTTFSLFDNGSTGNGYYSSTWSSSREVWIYGTDGKVPGISDTETYSTMLENIASGYGVSYDIPNAPVISPDVPQPVRIWRYLYDGETEIENEPSILFNGDDYRLNGLSVRPRFAVPQYVEEDITAAAYEYADSLGLEGAFDLEDINLAASRDVRSVFNSVKFTLISKDIPQLLAIVLPEVSIDEAGVYVFSVSKDNIPYGKKLFWYSDLASLEGTSSDEQIFMNTRGISIDTADYYTNALNVAVYLTEGHYEPVITAQATSNDVNLIKGILPPEPVTVRITTTRLANGEIGVPYRAEFTATHSTDVRWSMTSGALPSGLMFNSAGVISGTPSSSGTFTFGIRVSYQDVYDQERFTLTITGTDSSDTEPTQGDIPNASIGTLYVYVLVTAIENATWSLAEDSTLPEGLVLNPSTGQITGTPTEAGTYTFTVTATNGEASETRTIIIVIGVSSDVSPDIRPDSPDVRPSSPDITPPASNDQTGGTTSGDNTGGNSGDNSGGSGNGSSGGGENTVTITPISVVPESPRVDIQAVANAVIEILQSISNALASIITENTKVAELPENASGSSRTVDDMSDEDLASIPEAQTPAAVLPIIRVTEPAVYVFGVSLNNLEVGAVIFLHLMAEPASSTRSFEFYSAADEEEAYTFLDDDGNETKTVPANKHVNIAAYMTPENTYAPVITTASNNGDKADGTGPGESGSGGCSGGFSVYALFLLGLCVTAKSKK